MVQGLRLHTGWIPGGGTKIPHATQQKNKTNKQNMITISLSHVTKLRIIP